MGWELLFTQKPIVERCFPSGWHLALALRLSKTVRQAVAREPELVARVQFTAEFCSPHNRPIGGRDGACTDTMRAMLLAGQWLPRLLFPSPADGAPFPEPPEFASWRSMVDGARQSPIRVQLCCSSTMITPSPRTMLTLTVANRRPPGGAPVFVGRDNLVPDKSLICLCFLPMFERNAWTRESSGALREAFRQAGPRSWLQQAAVRSLFTPPRVYLGAESRNLPSPDQANEHGLPFASMAGALRRLEPGQTVRLRARAFSAVKGESLPVMTSGRAADDDRSAVGGVPPMLRARVNRMPALWTENYLYYPPPDPAPHSAFSVVQCATCAQSSSQFLQGLPAARSSGGGNNTAANSSADLPRLPLPSTLPPSPPASPSSSAGYPDPTNSTSSREQSTFAHQLSFLTGPDAVMAPDDPGVLSSSFVRVFALVCYTDDEQTARRAQTQPLCGIDDEGAVAGTHSPATLPTAMKFAVSNVLEVELRVARNQVSIKKKNPKKSKKTTSK